MFSVYHSLKIVSGASSSKMGKNRQPRSKLDHRSFVVELF